MQYNSIFVICFVVVLLYTINSTNIRVFIGFSLVLFIAYFYLRNKKDIHKKIDKFIEDNETSDSGNTINSLDGIKKYKKYNQL